MLAHPPGISSRLRSLLEAGEDGAIALASPAREPLTHACLRAAIDSLACQLASYGVQPGDRVATVLPGGVEAAIAFLGVSSYAVAAPLNPAYSAQEFRFYLDDLDARVVITAPGHATAIAEALDTGTLHLQLTLGEAGPRLTPVRGNLRDRPAWDPDIALVLHTSGTTSRPKMVPLTEANLVASAHNIVSTLALSPADRSLEVMPLFHIHGLIAGVLAPLSAGGSVVCPPGFDAFRFNSWLEEFRPTWYTAVPTIHQLVLQRGSAGHHESLRFVRSSSSPLPPTVAAALEQRFGVPAIEAYGMTEAAHQVASNPLPPGVRKPGSVGLGIGVDVTILDERGNELAAGETGEVAIRGENVTPGYHNHPSANAAACTGPWFRTGDQGYCDAGGYLHLTGRLKELINRGGEKISPREVDEVLLRHPAVAQAVAFAVPHSLLGEDIAAAVVLRDGASASEKDLRAHAAERLAPFKVPRSILILQEIPKGPTGKVQRIGMAGRLGLAASPRL